MKAVLLSLVLAPVLSRAADPAVTNGLSNGRAWIGMKTEIQFVYLVGLADGVRQATGAKPGPEAERKAADIVPRVLLFSTGNQATNGSTYGQIVSSSGARVIQLSLKVAF